MSLQDVIGQVNTDEILRDLGELVENLKVLGWKEVRPWSDFGTSLNPPELTYKNIEQRIITNFLHYRSNYLAIIACVFILRILLAPVLFLCIVICVALTITCVSVHKHPIKLGDTGIILFQQHKLAVCGGLSFVFLGLCGALEHLLWGLIISVLLCGMHMIFRARSVSSKANRVYDEVKLSSADWFGMSSGSTSTSTSYLDNKKSDISSANDRSHMMMEDPESAYSPTNSNDGVGVGAAGVYGGQQGGLTSASMRKRM